MMIKQDFLYVAGSDGHIVIYGKNDRAYYHTLKLHNKTVLDFDIHQSGQLLVSFGAEGKVKLIDLATMADVYHKNIKLGRKESNEAVDFVRFTPDNNLFFTVGSSLVLFNAEDNSEKIIKTFAGKITSIHLQGSLILLSGEHRFTQTTQEECISLTSRRCLSSHSKHTKDSE